MAQFHSISHVIGLVFMGVASSHSFSEAFVFLFILKGVSNDNDWFFGRWFFFNICFFWRNWLCFLSFALLIFCLFRSRMVFMGLGGGIFWWLGFFHGVVFGREWLEGRFGGVFGGGAIFIWGVDWVVDGHGVVDLFGEEDAGGVAFFEAIDFFGLFELAVSVVSATH